MLAAPLIRVTTRRGTIAPIFCSRSEELELARLMINAFQESYRAHERKSELYERISIIESSHNDYKLVRGLAVLLERRCAFAADPLVDGQESMEGGDVLTRAHQATIAIDPINVRRMLFKESASSGYALTDLERENIINSVSQSMHIPSVDIKTAMWSDLDENLIIKKFEEIDARALAGWYNLSLVQTLLFNATRMEFRISGGSNWKRVLRNVKRLGLMYYLENRSFQNDEVETADTNNVAGAAANVSKDNLQANGLVCSLEGPLSLFKLTDRYGTSLAKLLPSIVFSINPAEWQIDAWILRKTMMTQEKKLYRFSLSNAEGLPLLADPSNDIEHAEIHVNNNSNSSNNAGLKPRNGNPLRQSMMASADYCFDSTVEEKFARRFSEVAGERSGWRLVREPDPLIATDGKAFIPDFLFEKYGNRVYLEIVGFWTPEYLERKLQKIRGVMGPGMRDSNGHKNGRQIVDLLVAINEELTGSNRFKAHSSSLMSSVPAFLAAVPHEKLIFYKNDSVPIAPIINYLKNIDKKIINGKLNDPNLTVSFDYSKDIIPLEDIARNYEGVPIEVIARIVARDYGDRYIIIGSVGSQHQQEPLWLVSRTKTKQLLPFLNGVTTFAEACIILSENGVPETCHAELMDKMGFEVVWTGIDLRKAVIRLRKKEQEGKLET